MEMPICNLSAKTLTHGIAIPLGLAIQSCLVSSLALESGADLLQAGCINKEYIGGVLERIKDIQYLGEGTASYFS